MQPISLNHRDTAARLLSANRPLVVIHTRPDGDCVGAGAALCRFFISRGQEAHLLAPNKIPDRLAFLTEGISLWTADDGTASPDVVGRTVITVDVASRPQMGRLRDLCMTPDLQIDHHEKGEHFADHYVLPHAAAAGEIVLSLLLTLEQDGAIDRIPADCIDGLYAAIASDTGGFRFSNTTADTHRFASLLLERGAHAAHINRLLFDTKTKEMLQAEQLSLSKLKLDAEGRIAHIGISIADREAVGLLEEHFETTVDIARSLQGVEIAAAVREIFPGTFKVSLRAINTDVASVAALLGGGGHRLAAGLSIKATDTEEAWRVVLPHLCAALDFANQ